MTVIGSVFTHEHNQLDVAIQEYEHAKAHFREVLHYREATNPDHQKRFQDALERQEAARTRYLKVLAGG